MMSPDQVKTLGIEFKEVLTGVEGINRIESNYKSYMDGHSNCLLYLCFSAKNPSYLWVCIFVNEKTFETSISFRDNNYDKSIYEISDEVVGMLEIMGYKHVDKYGNPVVN